MRIISDAQSFKSMLKTVLLTDNFEQIMPDNAVQEADAKSVQFCTIDSASISYCVNSYCISKIDCTNYNKSYSV